MTGVVYFGSSVSITGDGSTIVVGSPLYSGGGAAYVFTGSGGVFSTTPTTTLTDPSPGNVNGDSFGSAATISGDGSTIVIGATGRNSNQGLTYVYSGSGGSYATTPVAFFTDPSPGNVSGDAFGTTLAVSGDGSTIVADTRTRNSNQGAAYVFTKSGGNYTNAPAASLTDPTPAAGTSDFFGQTVAVSASGSAVVVGAPGRNTVYTFGGGVPAALTPTAGSTPQSAGLNGAFATTLAVRVTDTNGAPFTGATVTFSAPTSGATGTFAGGRTTVSAVSDVNGLATAPTFTANTVTGTYAVTATVPTTGTGTATASFTLTNTPGPPAALTIRSNTTSQSATVGTAFALAPALIVSDSYGNPVSGISVTFTAPASGPSGRFAGTSVVTTDANGLATAPLVTANTVTGNYVISASAAGLSQTLLFSFTNTPAAPASIAVLSGSNQSAVLGTAFATPLQVIVRDAHNNLVPGAQVTFAGPTGTNTAGVYLPNGGITTTDASGIAAITATSSGRPGILSVTASVAGVTTPATFTLTNTADPAATVTLTGFSLPTGPTAGGGTITITGTNFSGATAVLFDTTAATGVTVVNSTTITVVVPGHAIGTVDITVTTNGQTASIHGYTYLPGGGIVPQPGLHPLPGSGSGVGGNAIPQPARHEDAGSGVQPQAAGAGMPTAAPNAQAARH